MAVKGGFLIKVNKEEVRQRIFRIGERFPHLYDISFRQDVAMLRTTWHDIISMMENCFEMNMAAATRYRTMLKNIARKDNPTGVEVYAVYGILVDFTTMVGLSIPVKDYLHVMK